MLASVLCKLHAGYCNKFSAASIRASGYLCAVSVLAGATGGVGKRVVQRLLQQGRVVRALVRDVDKAKSLLVSMWSLE